MYGILCLLKEELVGNFNKWALKGGGKW